MKIKLLSLLLALSIAACGGNSEPAGSAAENLGTITTEQSVENNRSAQNGNGARESGRARDGAVRNGADLMTRFDVNEDGVLQADEVPENFDFATLDANMDGVLDESEMVLIADGLQRGAGAQRGVGGLMVRLDTDNDGLISQAEAPVEWSFAEYDTNGDSFINADELAQIRPAGNRTPGN
ncbi:MAG: EF-hand domain-containing protein [Chloroflexota bacterium]